jgi:hypothetical protein
MQFQVDVSKSTGTVVSTATATITVNADSDTAARRVAMEMLADDSSDIAWTAIPAVATVPTANATAHVTAVHPVAAATTATK